MKPIRLTYLQAAVLAAFLLPGPALAHGDAQWIQSNPTYRDAAGVHCCGVNDCAPVPASEVYTVSNGYFVRGFHVPLGQTLPSLDGQFWACVKPGGIRCFFAPLMG